MNGRLGSGDQQVDGPPTGLQALAYRAYDSPLPRVLYPIERHAVAWRRRLQERRRVCPV